MPKYTLITFDIFSAILDIENSAVPQLEAILRRPKEECLSFFKTWRGRQWDYLLLSSCMGKGFLSYWDITSKTLEYSLKKNYFDSDGKTREELMSVWTRFSPWPESRSVVNKVKRKGYGVAMLSNGDEKMLRKIGNFCEIEFDYIFSADQCQQYKPGPKIYNLPYVKAGIPKKETLHVAGSLFDAMGAKAAGCSCAWVNRSGEYVIDEDFRPDYEMDNLNGLTDIL